MSRDRRDQRGGHPLRNPYMLDCMCCEVSTKHDATGTAFGRTRAQSESYAIAEQPPVPADVDPLEAAEAPGDPHAYLAGRCVRCHVSEHDDLPGHEPCAPKQDDEPITFTSESGRAPRSSHPSFLA